MIFQPPERTFVLTGTPRSGTTYLAALLHDPPGTITLSESGGRWKRFYQEHGRSTRVFELFAEHRRRIERGEEVMTFASALDFRAPWRVDTWNHRKTPARIAAAPGFHLGLKNPEVFLALLAVFIDAGVKCVISVRHPVPVINSWVKRVRHRLVRGLAIHGTFANGECVSYRSTEADPVSRRINLFNYFTGLIIAAKDHPNVMLVRHEDWCVSQVEQVHDFLGLPSPEARELHPPLVPHDPVELPESEIERIASECTIASELGYALDNARLAAAESPCARQEALA